MTLPSDPSDKNRQNLPVFGLRMAGLGAEIGCLTLVVVLVGVFGGIWLDRVLGTKPIFTILLVFGSAPLSLAFTYWLAMRAVKDANPPPPADKKTYPKVEEDTGE